MGTREAKAEVIGAVKEQFDKSSAAVFVTFAGLDVPRITDLRARFREAGVQYKVVKNRLILQALKGIGLEEQTGFRKSLTGMTGVAWSFEDPSAAAKIIQKFRKEHDDNQKLEVKGGVMDKRFLSPDRVERDLANLPGKNELRASLLAQLMAPAQSTVRQLMAPAQNLLYALDARRRQLEGGSE
jgi:large subunit ribosomal protein L10